MTSLFNILGFSDATCSMILDSVFQPQLEVRIIQNMPVKSSLPYEIPGINTTLATLEQVQGEELNNCILGVWKPDAKKKVVSAFGETNPIYTSVIDPNAYVAHTVTSGVGVYVGPHTTIAPYAELGNFVSINRNCSVGHHTHIGDYCTLNPGCNIAGRCHIGDGVTIGMGANIVDGVKVGENSFVAAGSLVTKDVPESTYVFGVPASVVKTL